MKNPSLVHIYTTSDKATADLIKGLFESNNIKVLIKPPVGYSAFGAKTGGISVPFYDWLIYVPRDEEKEAKKLLEEFEKGKKEIKE